MARGLKQGKSADNIRLDECCRASNGAINVRFGSTVYDGIDVMLMKKSCDKSLVADITLDEAMAVRTRQVRKIL
jgi:hypothetical protein